jgi:hypothetical protein
MDNPGAVRDLRQLYTCIYDFIGTSAHTPCKIPEANPEMLTSLPRSSYHWAFVHLVTLFLDTQFPKIDIQMDKVHQVLEVAMPLCNLLQTAQKVFFRPSLVERLEDGQEIVHEEMCEGLDSRIIDLIPRFNLPPVLLKEFNFQKEMEMIFLRDLLLGKTPFEGFHVDDFGSVENIGELIQRNDNNDPKINQIGEPSLMVPASLRQIASTVLFIEQSKELLEEKFKRELMDLHAPYDVTLCETLLKIEDRIFRQLFSPSEFNDFFKSLKHLLLFELDLFDKWDLLAESDQLRLLNQHLDFFQFAVSADETNLEGGWVYSYKFKNKALQKKIDSSSILKSFSVIFHSIMDLRGVQSSLDKILKRHKSNGTEYILDDSKLLLRTKLHRLFSSMVSYMNLLIQDDLKVLPDSEVGMNYDSIFLLEKQLDKSSKSSALIRKLQLSKLKKTIWTLGHDDQENPMDTYAHIKVVDDLVQLLQKLLPRDLRRDLPRYKALEFFTWSYGIGIGNE